ncbi:MAG: thiamine pyrophosphate-dependent dehydrogenase E1 component subunit alpha [Syntrophobacteraceae bacterium]
MVSSSLALYRKMYLIRRTEEAICRHYSEDEMKTPVHLSLGEEAIAAGVIHALGAEDQFFATYRCHGVYLARTGETDRFFAELYGKETGLLKGKAGSMHLSAPDFGFMGSSAIVGGIIPVAIGAAYANKVAGNGRIVAVFFGDGATEEGVFWESINAACLMELPILFVCEDNELAVFTGKAERRGFDSLPAILEKYRCTVITDSTTDVERVYQHAGVAIHSIREKKRPCFLNLSYYRYLEHVGVCEDFHSGYRAREEFEKWFEIDPVKMQRARLLSLGYPEPDLGKMESKIDSQIAASIGLAAKAPFPCEEELCREVFA